MSEPINEFRKDPISGDWVLFATQRAKRPDWHSAALAPASAVNSETSCPFDNPRASGQEVVAEYQKESGQPWITVITNKYPAVSPKACEPIKHFGPFGTTPANGFHEVVITTDHQRGFSEFNQEETQLVLKVFQERYRAITQYQCGNYIQIFNNSGSEAGASVAHSHSQIISTPIIPPQIARGLNGAAGFYLKNDHRSVYLFLLAWERQENKRIVFENSQAVAYCPFVSKKPYEIKLVPRQPQAYFEKATEEELEKVAEALRFCFQQLKKIFPRLAFNFFIHTAPVRGENLFPFPYQDFYQWHIEIIPYFSKMGGLDFSTGVMVNIIDPDQAARQLREGSLS